MSLSLVTLPTDLKWEVEEYLDDKDLAHLEASASIFRDANDSILFWKGRYLQRMKSNPFYEQPNSMVDFKQGYIKAFLISKAINRFNFNGEARLTNISAVVSEQDGRFFTVTFKAALKDIRGNNWFELDVFNDRENVINFRGTTTDLTDEPQSETQTVVWIKDCKKPCYSAMIVRPDASIESGVDFHKGRWGDRFDYCGPETRYTCIALVKAQMAIFLIYGVPLLSMDLIGKYFEWWK